MELLCFIRYPPDPVVSVGVIVSMKYGVFVFVVDIFISYFILYRKNI